MESDASEEMLSSEDLFSAEENNEEHEIQHPSVPSGAKPCRRFSAAQVACLKLFRYDRDGKETQKSHC